MKSARSKASIADIESDRRYLFEYKDKSEKSAKEKIAKSLRSMYDNTQEFFRRNGITHVKLYRGTSTSEAYGTKEGDIVSFDDNILASWTTNKATTNFFHQGITISAVVPVEKIIGSCMTGFGCWNEYEFVVLGSNEPVYAKVEKVTSPPPSDPF